MAQSPLNWYLLPPEIWGHVFNFASIRDKVNCRLVSKKIKAFSELNLSRLLVVYASDDESKDFIPVASPLVDEKLPGKYKRTEGNFLLLTPSPTPEVSLTLNANTLVFLSKYCKNLEALITLADVPFATLAKTIGPRLVCFAVSSGRCNPARAYTKEHVKKMAKLQFFSGKDLPCPFEFIECSVPLIAANMICHKNSGRCPKHQQKVSLSVFPNNLIFLVWRSQGPRGALVNPPFSESIRVLKLIMMDAPLSFRLPNLSLLGVNALTNSSWVALFESIKHSKDLTILCIRVPQLVNYVLENLVPILVNFPYLRNLIFLPKTTAANEPINLTDAMIDSIAQNCLLLTYFYTKKDSYQEEQLEKLRLKIPKLQINNFVLP